MLQRNSACSKLALKENFDNEWYCFDTLILRILNTLIKYHFDLMCSWWLWIHTDLTGTCGNVVLDHVRFPIFQYLFLASLACFCKFWFTEGFLCGVLYRNIYTIQNPATWSVHMIDSVTAALIWLSHYFEWNLIRWYSSCFFYNITAR